MFLWKCEAQEQGYQVIQELTCKDLFIYNNIVHNITLIEKEILSSLYTWPK